MPSTFRQRKGSRAGRAFLLLAMVVLGAVPAANAGSPTYAHVLASRAALESSVARNVPHHILVKFKAGVSRALISRVERRAGLRTIHRFGSFGIHLMYTSRDDDVSKAARRLNRRAAVDWAEPDYIRYPLANPPTDALFSDQWDLNNTGQPHAVAETSLDGSAADHTGANGADIDLPQAWTTAGNEGNSSTVIAVIDSGVDVSHPDLSNQIWVNDDDSGDGLDDDGNGKVDDTNGWDFGDGDNTLLSPNHWEGFDHGSHLTGTIAAAHDDATGTVGICPGCRIMALKTARDANGAMPVSAEVKALAYAKANGARIANLSFGSPQFSNAEREAIRKSGLLAVVAAGNDSLDNDMALAFDVQGNSDPDIFSPLYPAAYTLPNIVTVAASNDQDRYAYSTECFAILNSRSRCAFTNWGHDSVDVAAPGADITSTVPGNSWETWDGTSMAAPHVAGIAGLVLSQNPLLSIAELKNALMHGVDDPTNLHTMYLAPPLNRTKSGSFTRTSGRVNANDALSASTANATPVTDGNVDHAASWSSKRKAGSVAWPNDINDVFKRRLGKGHTYRFTLTVPAGQDYDLLVWKPGTKEIWQFDGTNRLQKFSARGNGVDDTVKFTAKKTGTFYIHVSAWLFKSGKYTLRAKRLS
jgi:subtilisin family serine protease